MGTPLAKVCCMCGKEFRTSRLSWLNGFLCGVMLIWMVTNWIVGSVAGAGPYLILLIPLFAMAFVHMRWVGLVPKGDDKLKL
jgi:hypothetical protein